MKKFKKTLAMTAAALISFSSICSGSIQPLIGNVNTVSAAYTSELMKYGDELSYRKVDNDEDGIYDYAEISDCFDMVTEINIPSEIDGLPVNSISSMSSVSLTSITIPDSVTSIGDYAFRGCINLTSITISKSVVSIGYNAFSGCKSLDNINVSEYNNNFSSVEGVLFDKEKTVLIKYPGGNTRSEYVIPDSVTSIGQYAFGYCTALTGATIPDSVTSIEKYAFYECTGLTSITIPDGITSIEEWTFWGCSNLTDVTIPDSVTSIKQQAFGGNLSLTDITIPDSVTSIGQYAFGECSSLTSITIPNGITSIEDGTFFRCQALRYLTIPDSVTSFGSSAFSECSSLTDITIPSCATEIAPETFEYCSGLKSITIPDGVTSIGGYAFSFCTGLTSIIIPDNVTSIGRAFEGCTGLTNITIPDSVTSIDTGAFYLCYNLENINVSENNNNFSSVDGVLFNKEKSKLLQYPFGSSKSEYAIPDSVTSIGEYAFYGCAGLTSITIPDSVTSIEDNAFERCTRLKVLSIPDSVESIGSSAFQDCTGLTSVAIPDSVTSIESGTFYGCTGLTSVTIPGSVTSIKESAFSECSSLTSITIPDSVTSIKGHTFYHCSSLTSITIKNPECKIYDHSSTICNSDDCLDNYSYKGVIFGYENSTAQAYAGRYGYEFKSLGNSSFLRGDISGNGKIDLQDVIQIAKFIIGTRTFTSEEINIADYNNDGKVGLQDVIGVARCLLKSDQNSKFLTEDLTIGIKSQEITGAEADDEFILGQTQFALNLFKNTVSDEENTFISPYSVMQALAMTANGADNDTKAQMEKVLGGMSIEKLNEYLYTQRIGQPNSASCKLTTANSIWYKNDSNLLTVLPEFLQRNADYYGASAYSSPFDDTTVNDINNWVSQKTDNMIPDLLNYIPEDARMFLINAVAFDAKWENQYSGHDVNDYGHFKAFDGSSQEVRMMSSVEQQYLEDENAAGFYKYYEGGRYAFAALLPNEGMSVSEYINTLTPESLYNTLSNSQEKTVHAAIPKFSYDYDVLLNNTLSDMGMSNAFDGEHADFTKMIQSDENIYIDSVFHKTHIDVTEEGTKAAAVTAVMTCGAAAPDDEIKYVTLNRPFVYCIVDTQTSLPVFIGAVNSVEG